MVRTEEPRDVYTDSSFSKYLCSFSRVDTPWVYMLQDYSNIVQAADKFVVECVKDAGVMISKSPVGLGKTLLEVLGK
jgi:hypothetical protein